MKTLKKNQIVVFVIGIMIITAGYLSFSNNNANNLVETGAILDSEEMASIGDARLVSANVAEENTNTTSMVANETAYEGNAIEAEIGDTNTIEKTNSNGGASDIVETNAEGISTEEYFTNSKLERNTMYSEQIENYQDI